MARRAELDPGVQSANRLQLDLSGKVALVTGGTRGIGHDICRAFIDAGARVALCSRDGAAAEQTASAFGEGTRGYACDVGVAAQVEAFAKAVEKDFGQIDVLVNNAGFTKDTLLFLMTEADWDSVVDTNLDFWTLGLAPLGSNQFVEIVVKRSVGPEPRLVEKSLDSAAQTNLIGMALGAHGPTHLAVPAAAQQQQRDSSQARRHSSGGPQPVGFPWFFGSFLLLRVGHRTPNFLIKA